MSVVSWLAKSFLRLPMSFADLEVGENDDAREIRAASENGLDDRYGSEEFRGKVSSVSSRASPFCQVESGTEKSC